METRQYTTVTQPSTAHAAAFGFDGADETRLNALLAENERIAREHRLYPTGSDFLDAQLMKNPLGVEKAFGYFGLLLGVFPPAAIFYQMFHRETEEIFLFVLLLLMNAACAVAGYFSGKLVGRMTFDTEFKSWNRMILLVPLIGILWGIVAGAAGGVLFFVIGAVFGAVCAAAVGAVALPAFAVFHRLLKRGEFIERSQFLPVAFGIALAISAFILGL